MQGESGAIPAHAACIASSIGRRRLVFTWQSPHTGPNETLVTVDFLRVGKSHRGRGHSRETARERTPGASRGWTSGLEHLDRPASRDASDDALLAGITNSCGH